MGFEFLTIRFQEFVCTIYIQSIYRTKQKKDLIGYFCPYWTCC